MQSLISTFLGWATRASLLISKNILWAYIVCISLFSGLTYLSNYHLPNSSIWDETYHITSGEKYLTGTMLMEAHPPLGKLLIALGEKIVNPNAPLKDLNILGKICLATTPLVQTIDGKKVVTTTLKARQSNPTKLVDKSSFTTTDSIGIDNNNDGVKDSDYPEYFSYCGFRLIPALFGFGIPLIFFWLLWLMTRNPHLSAIGSSLVIFDNALLVQSRAAMLDSIQIFLVLGACCFFVSLISDFLDSQLIKPQWKTLLKYLGLGLTIGLALVTKHSSAFLLLLPVIAIGWELVNIATTQTKLYRIWKNQNPTKKFYEDWLDIVDDLVINIIPKISIVLLTILFAYCSIFYIHTGLGATINSKASNNQGLYKASDQYQDIIKSSGTWNPLNFPIMFEDNWNYMEQYHKGVPKLDPTNKNENGSYPSNWPVMNKTISFKWETANYSDYQIMYLIGNPLIWLTGLAGIILSISLIISVIFFGNRIKNLRSFVFIMIFAFLWLVYMATMLYVIEIRVMYLYHYLIALVFSLVLPTLLIEYLYGRELRKDTFKSNLIYLSLVSWMVAVFVSYLIYAPFTYYLPLSHDGFKARQLFGFWQMKWPKD